MQQKYALKEMRTMREAAGISLGSIAGQTGLAVQTVQRMFAGGRVSDTTRDRVLVVVKKALAKKTALIERLNASSEAAPAV
jgi:hypothetical protein